jgi:DNA-binding transcriptional regulator YiaG
MVSKPKNSLPPDISEKTPDRVFLRSIREKMLLGRADFAKLLSVSTFHVRNIERGDEKISARLRLRIEDLLHPGRPKPARRIWRYDSRDSDYCKDMRAAAHCSQRQFAELLEVRPSLISNIEARRCLIPSTLRRKIADLFRDS